MFMHTSCHRTPFPCHHSGQLTHPTPSLLHIPDLEGHMEAVAIGSKLSPMMNTHTDKGNEQWGGGGG